MQPEPGIRRRADILFTKARVAVFVDGCFWHKCPVHGTEPKANAEWWRAKLQRNVERDRDTDRRLEEAGWTVIRLWEHEDPALGSAVILDVLAKAAAVQGLTALATGSPSSRRGRRIDPHRSLNS